MDIIQSTFECSDRVLSRYKGDRLRIISTVTGRSGVKFPFVHHVIESSMAGP